MIRTASRFKCRSIRTFSSSDTFFAPPGSSLADPFPTLFRSPPTTTDPSDPNLLLRNDVKTMGAILGSSIRSTAGSKVFDQVEMLRSKTKAWRDGSGSLSDVQKEVKKFSNSDLLKNARAFAHFLRLANVAESHHRVRMLSQPSSSLSASSILALPSKPDSCGGTISSLLSSGSTTAEEIFEALSTQKTELILTAHPTEVNRKTLLNHTAKIQSLLSQADDVRSGGTKYEQMEVDSGLRSSIASIWQSDEVSRFKPTVQSEAYRGTLVVSTVLWKAVPSFLRKLDAEMRSGLGEDKGLPLKSAPVQFGSWMGGDRDGNPNVTSNVTREVALVNRLEAASLILADLDALHEELSLVSAGDELVGRVGEGTREPYRIYLRGVIDKMQRTIEEVGSDLDDVREGRGGYDHSGGFDALYFDTDDLCEDLSVIHRSLSDTGNGSVARGRLTDLIRNLQCFGLTLVPLDLRQEADRHEDAMDAITRYLGQGSYKGWDEDTKVAWLGKQIAGKRPLIGKGTWRKPRNEKFFTPEVVEVLDTFEMAAEQGPGTLGAYVISQATLASDVMSVLLLQLSSGCLSPLRVAPLFETLDDLKGAENTMRTLWDNPAYMGRCRGKQEIMVGYSDSAKDAGRLAASWAQYETQEKLAKMGRDKGVEVTFFHGKGGTVGRGGNPATFHAILGHPPETIDGRFRVTEQGEMINQNFGHPYIAERTLDIYTAAVLAEGFREEEKVGSEWRSAMDRLSDVSVSEYRGIVRGDERFVPYFRSSTPELELTGLNIGSRPAKRKPGGGVESLRAIPWNMAWTQTRCNLPTWLGVGSAIGGAMEGEDKEVITEMYEKWGAFRTVVDLVEMVMVKSEGEIHGMYEDALVGGEERELGRGVRGKMIETEDALKALTRQEVLGGGNKLLKRGLEVRNPYVDCLNALQVECLRRLRMEGDIGNKNEEGVLRDALMISVNGIANGMKNTG